MCAVPLYEVLCGLLGASGRPRCDWWPSAPQPPQGGSGDDISSVVEENRVPIPFLIILSLNFLLILVDRALYLRKTALWKLVFQYVLVVVVHGWLFFVLPAMTDR